MAKLAASLWLDVEWFRPDPADGRAATFQRDYDLAASADLVLCFFSSLLVRGGTAHVVEAAQSRDVPVYAWGFDGVTFKSIGSWDPDLVWNLPEDLSRL